METSPITKTYDPFPKLTEYNAAQISPKASPKTSPSKLKENNIMSSPVIAEYSSADVSAVPPMSLTDKIDSMINIIDNQMLFKESGAGDNGHGPVLVEWEPKTEKSVHSKREKEFQKWSKDLKPNKNEENFESLEQDYLNLSNLEQQNEANNVENDK